mgnify:CR=1 FL=1
MLMWGYITVFVSSFSITSYCVYNNCFNYIEDENDFDESVINMLQDSYKEDSYKEDSYKLSRIDENDYY